MSGFAGAIQSLGNTIDLAGNLLRNLTDENRLLRMRNEEQAFALARLIVAFDVMRIVGTPAWSWLPRMRFGRT